MASEALRDRPWSLIEREIAGVLARVDSEQFAALLGLFRRRDHRFFFAGQGRSGLIGQMAAMRFMHAGLHVHVVGEPTAPAVRRGDTLVLVCGSGQSPSASHSARSRKRKVRGWWSSRGSRAANSPNWRTPF